MTIRGRFVFVSLISAATLGAASPAMAQNCTRQGTDVTCDDGRRGVFTGDAIIWPDGTRANLVSPHPSVIIGNKQSVIVGPACSSARVRAVCRSTIRARRTRRAAPCSTACPIVTERSARSGPDGPR